MDDPEELHNCQRRLAVVDKTIKLLDEERHSYGVEKMHLQTRIWTLKERIARSAAQLEEA